MRRNFFVWICAATVAGGILASRSDAQSPSAISTHYRVLPRHSTMHRTGGFAGIDATYRVMGEYDFVRGSNTGGPKFVNSEMWGSLLSDGPVAAFVLDVDRIFNLKGLQGKPLPTLAPQPTVAPFDAYKFSGVSEDGSSISLIATRLGPWMYLRGWTQPPPGSADFFEHQLRVLARTGPFADLNSDDVVDAADFALFRKSGSAAGSGLLAGAGYADLRQQFGERVPDLAALDAIASAAMSTSFVSAAVPEPGSVLLVVIGLTAMIVRSRRRVLT